MPPPPLTHLLICKSPSILICNKHVAFSKAHPMHEQKSDWQLGKVWEWGYAPTVQQVNFNYAPPVATAAPQVCKKQNGWLMALNLFVFVVCLQCCKIPVRMVDNLSSCKAVAIGVLRMHSERLPLMIEVEKSEDRRWRQNKFRDS